MKTNAQFLLCFSTPKYFVQMDFSFHELPLPPKNWWIMSTHLQFDSVTVLSADENVNNKQPTKWQRNVFSFKWIFFMFKKADLCSKNWKRERSSFCSLPV